MKEKSRKYIYISNKEAEGTVFQTQVLDWLHLFKENGITFDLIQAFHVKDLKKPSFVKQQISFITSRTKLKKGYIFLFPSKSLFAIVNAIIIYLKIYYCFRKYDEIVIFSRALIGKEISLLRKLTRTRIIFCFDARAASAEEHKYLAVKQHNFTRKKYNVIADVYYLEFETITAADKIFAVSKVLMNYFINTFAANPSKFVNYPCLSDSDKFYFDPHIRAEIRKKLNVSDHTRLFVYSGGLESEWHLTLNMFAFYSELLSRTQNLVFLFLTGDINRVESATNTFPVLKSHLLSFSVANNEVYKYLNAADYGVLFRENTIMNNVASPTKFAEYMLCGLPVIISEGVGDYSTYVVYKEVGVLLKESELKNLQGFNYETFLTRNFDRARIAGIGKLEFSKQSIVNTLIDQFKS